MPVKRDIEDEVIDSEKSGRTHRPRISIIMDENGAHPDIERIKPEMQDKIRSFLADPENLRAFGFGQEQQSAMVQFADDAIGAVLKGLEFVEALVALGGGIPLDIGVKAFHLSEQQKQTLTPHVRSILERLAKRYPWLFTAVKNQDVLIVAFIISVQFSTCYKHAKAEANERKAAKAMAEAIPEAEESVQ